MKKIKLLFWRAASSVFPYVRDTLLRLHIIWHEKGRQRYVLGRLVPEKTLEELKAYLISQGFSNHFIAWIDEGEYCGLRFHDGDFQYHLRLFKDGEVRGHYEATPENHPIRHFVEIGMEDRTNFFMKFLQGWVSNPVSSKGI